MKRFLAILLLLIGAAALFGYAGARRTPQIVRYTVALADWPAGQPPLRVVQLSDVHASWIDMPPSRIDAIVAQANALAPDVIVLTGDYSGGKIIDWPHIRLEQFTDRLGGLRAPLGVYAVVGNHDTRRWMRWAFGRTNIRLLINQNVDIGPVVLVGVDDLSNMDPLQSMRAGLIGRAPGKPVIMLAHEPEFFLGLPRAVDLLIAGHTHGGQIKLPLIGARDLGPFLNAHLRGRFDEQGKQMVVSSGLGTSIVPLRIGVRPEIVEITVGPKAG